MAQLVFFEVEQWEKDHLHSSFAEREVTYTDEKLNDRTVAQFADAEIISVFIYSTLSKAVLEKMPRLKAISTRSTGFDHIDTVYCKEKGIVVMNVPKYGAHTVAEHTFALILALSRKLIPSAERSKRGDFSLEGLSGFDLHGKMLGIVGCGNIGTRVAEIALAFQMHVQVFAHHEDDALKAKGVSFVPLETLLQTADIVTLHVPGGKDTFHLINMENIKLFKKGSYLINTARGSIVETQAILEGLEQGILAGAGLDVLEEECSLREERELLTGEYLQQCDIKTQLLNHVLLTRNDVVITPHNAFNSFESLREIIDTTVANIKSFEANAPQNIAA